MTAPESFEALVALIASQPRGVLARAIAGQAVIMGTLAEWDSETIEHVAAQTMAATDGLDLPTFTGSCDDAAALKFWCSIDPSMSFEEWAEVYGWPLPCSHRWELVEENYMRMWKATLDDDGTVRAHSSQFADEGSGEVKLECLECGEVRDVPGEVIYQ